VFLAGRPIRRGQLGLGRRAGVFDAEMVALASAMAAARNILTDHPQAKHLIFLTDNQAALRAIDDLSDHPGQFASIIFHKHLDHLMSSNNDFRVTVSWIPGHEGFAGNEEADRLAKDAVTAGPPLLRSTITWARERAKSSALKAWRREWRAKPHTNLASVGLVRPPSLHLAKFHKEYGGPRHVHTRVVQTILGHGFTGEFYQRFLPNLPSECPCGTVMTQTRSHILAECPEHEEHRDILASATQDLSIPILLGTLKGLAALARFIAASNAFRKT
jgi:ribonuclease HI